MKSIRLGILLFIYSLIILNIPIESLALIVTSSPNNPSLSLFHGQSGTINLKFTGDTTTCSVQCDWGLINNELQTGVNQGTFNFNAGSYYTLPIILTAPTIDQAKGDTSSVLYLLAYECKKVYSLFCLVIGQPDEGTSTITLNYDLAPEVKTARDYVKSQLYIIGPVLKDVESNIYNINTKITALPKNVLAGDLRNTLSTYQPLFSNYKNNYDSTNNFIANRKYLEAKNNIDINLLNNLNILITNLNTLDTNMAERIKEHNDVINKLNDVKQKISELKITASLVNTDISDVATNYDALSNSFQGGSFISYQEIKDKITTLTNEINSKKEKISLDFRNIIKNGNNLISLEKNKLPLEVSLFSKVSENDIELLNATCFNINILSKNFEDYNKNKEVFYAKSVEEVKDYNANYLEVNKKISDFNKLVDSISFIVNKNNIKNVDYSLCQNELIALSNLGYKELKNFTETNYSNCLSLNKALLEEKNKQENSFVFKLISFFRSLWPFDNIKFEKLKELKPKELPGKPANIEFSEDTNKFVNSYCTVNFTIVPEKISFMKGPIGQNLTTSNIQNVIERENQCCAFNVCVKCCDNECANDEGSYPVILLHGHSTFGDSPEKSFSAFSNIQFNLYSENFLIGGIVRPSDQKSQMVAGEWGKTKFPTTVKSTYYYAVYDSQGNLIDEPSQDQSISIYAQRLRDIVELVKYRTGRNKVNIVAHSMGGLVAREYIRHYGGDAYVNKLIMVGTPNHGTYGQVSTNCPFLAPQSKTECAEMDASSNFIANLNSGDETFGNVKYYTIAGSGCVLGGIDGDGISRVESVKLNGATNVIVNGQCEDPVSRGFHSNLLNPDKYLATYNYIKQFLKE